MLVDAPARLKKELDAVLTLQADLDTVTSAIQLAKSQLQASPGSSHTTRHVIKSLERANIELIEKVETLYSSLNIHDSFPELNGVDLDFVRTLLLARDLKINIRKRAIGSFFEWERLDQAVGGKNQVLGNVHSLIYEALVIVHNHFAGTKMHQNTRKAIAKRKPALMTALQKFNTYCATLASLHRPEWSIPVLRPLPTQLSVLRDSENLLEDVWVTPTNGKVPRWLDDVDVRNGIRAMLKVNRCLEERRRLGLEADNLCRWFGSELAAVQLALESGESKSLVFSFLYSHQTTTDELLHVHLKNRMDRLLLLKTRWTTPLGSAVRFDLHVANATEIARRILGIAQPSRSLTWISTTYPEKFFTLADDEDDIADDGICENDCTPEVDSDQTVLSDILAADDDSDSVQTGHPDGVQKDEMRVVWALPVSNLDAKINTGNHYPLQMHIKVDLFQDLHHIDINDDVPPQNIKRICPRQDGFAPFVFDTSDIDILISDTARLNDVCLNGGAVVLYRYISSVDPTYAQRCAILSTFELVRIRNNVSNNNLWRNIWHTLYWKKPVWILPIHRTQPVGHWVVATIYTDTNEIHLFDSLAGRRAWKDDVEVSSVHLYHSCARSTGT